MKSSSCCKHWIIYYYIQWIKTYLFCTHVRPQIQFFWEMDMSPNFSLYHFTIIKSESNKGHPLEYINYFSVLNTIMHLITITFNYTWNIYGEVTKNLNLVTLHICTYRTMQVIISTQNMKIKIYIITYSITRQCTEQ